MIFTWFFNFPKICILSWWLQSDNKKWESLSSFLSYKRLKLKLRVLLAGQVVTMVTCYTKKGFTATFYQLLGKTTTLHGHQNWTYLVSSTPDYLKRTFSGVSVKIWNEIPSRLKKLSKKKSFPENNWRIPYFRSWKKRFLSWCYKYYWKTEVD